MKYFFVFMLLWLFAGCKQKVISGAELESKLIETMEDYLHKTLKPDVKFTIKDVIYYPEKRENAYLCQFHVNIHFGSRDTTGVMAATISNDFSKIERTQ